MPARNLLCKADGLKKIKVRTRPTALHFGQTGVSNITGFAPAVGISTKAERFSGLDGIDDATCLFFVFGNLLSKLFISFAGPKFSRLLCVASLYSHWEFLNSYLHNFNVGRNLFSSALRGGAGSSTGNG